MKSYKFGFTFNGKRYQLTIKSTEFYLARDALEKQMQAEGIINVKWFTVIINPINVMGV